MFGKLFGYLAIIRSGSLAKQTDAVCLNILDRIIFLHNKRTWVQELTIEALLSLLAALPRAALLEPAMNKISSLLKSEEGLNANQIMLNIALQQFAAVSKDFKKVFDAAVPAEERISINSLEEHAQALIQSAKKFPQVHKVWDYIMSYIAPLSSERELPSQRYSTLPLASDAPPTLTPHLADCSHSLMSHRPLWLSFCRSSAHTCGRGPRRSVRLP